MAYTLNLKVNDLGTETGGISCVRFEHSEGKATMLGDQTS